MTNDSKRATLAALVCVDGTKLSPILIFKGAQNDWIVKKKLPNFPFGSRYLCQENAWMKKGAMIEWVENILKPYIDVAPENIVLLLVLDFY